MKHYSPLALQRLASLAQPRPFSEDDLRALLRRQLAERGKPALARALGLTEFRLTGILRGRFPVPDSAAQALGYRRATYFEPI